MRILFIGSPPFGIPSFEAVLSSGHEVVGLITPPEKRGGRGLSTTANNLVSLAESSGIPVLRPPVASGGESLAALEKLRPDLGVVVSYGQILTAEFLNLPRFGCINLHGSLLPRWRGASPVQASILAGDASTGVCVQKMVLALDAGPVLLSRRVKIGARETGPSLQASLAQEGGLLLESLFTSLGEGPLPPGEEQDPECVTICRKVQKEDGRLDWGLSATEIDRCVRAYSGWPWAFTSLAGEDYVRILGGRVAANVEGESPGVIVTADEEGLVVACGDGSFLITEIQRPGRQALPVAEFLRGFPLAPGDRIK